MVSKSERSLQPLQIGADDKQSRIDLTPGRAILYFDSNSLIKGAWPRLRGLHEVFSVCRKNGLQLAIPEPVRRELRAQFVRDASKQKGEIERLGRRMLESPDGVVEAIDQFVQSYDRLVETIYATFDIWKIPITDRPIDFLFEHALQQNAPFGDKGENFKDVVIFYTILDDIKRNRWMRAALITSNGHFRNAEQFTEDTGLRFLTVENLHALLATGDSTDLANAPSKSWLSLKRAGQRFYFASSGIELLNRGGEPGGLSARSSCSPCRPGDSVSIGGVLSGDFIGSGPGTIDGQKFERLYYSGTLEFAGTCTPTGPGDFTTPFSCAGVLTLYKQSPFVAHSRELFRVRLDGKGEAVLSVSSMLDPSYGTLLDFQELTYEFRQIALELDRGRDSSHDPILNGSVHDRDDLV